MAQTMTTAEARILKTLRDQKHRLFTRRQLQVCGLSETSVRVSVTALLQRGLIEERRNGFTLSAHGRFFAATARGHAVLDVPTHGG